MLKTERWSWSFVPDRTLLEVGIRLLTDEDRKLHYNTYSWRVRYSVL